MSAIDFFHLEASGRGSGRVRGRVLTGRRRRRARRGAGGWRRAGGARGASAGRAGAGAGCDRALRWLRAARPRTRTLHATHGRASRHARYLRRCAARGASTSGGAGAAAGAAPSHGHVTPDTRSPAHTPRLYTLTTIRARATLRRQSVVTPPSGQGCQIRSIATCFSRPPVRTRNETAPQLWSQPDTAEFCLS